jgi:hypothetical protein
LKDIQDSTLKIQELIQEGRKSRHQSPITTNEPKQNKSKPNNVAPVSMNRTANHRQGQQNINHLRNRLQLPAEESEWLSEYTYYTEVSK